MLNIIEKNLYNTYLRISRTARNKPYRSRQDFENFKDEDHINLRKLISFFTKFRNVSSEDYFRAPYEVYKDHERFDLSYYTTQKAIKAYTLYMQQKEEQDPDNPEQLKFVTDSFRFIALHCLKNNIPVEKYLWFSSGAVRDWLHHYKSHNVSVYALLIFPELDVIIHNLPPDERELFIGESGNVIKFRERLAKSTECKRVVYQSYEKIKKFVAQNLKS